MPLAVQSLKLPQNYAELLLQREINAKLERQTGQNSLCKLLELYSLGFEYYESIGSYKYKYFQLRMKQVFQKQEEDAQNDFLIKNISNSDKSPLASCGILSLQTQLILQRKQRESQRNQYLKEVQIKTSVNATNKEIKQLLLCGDYKAIQVYTKVNYELAVQEKMLQQKLQERHHRSFKSKKYGSTLKFNQTKTSLLSQSSLKGEILGQRELLFEKIINEHQESEENPLETGQIQIQKGFIFIEQSAYQ